MRDSRKTLSLIYDPLPRISIGFLTFFRQFEALDIKKNFVNNTPKKIMSTEKERY